MNYCIDEYLDARRLEGLSEGTIANYRFYLDIFCNSVQKDPKLITAKDIRKFLSEYRDTRNVKKQSLDKVRMCLTTFFKWLFREGYIEMNPCENIGKIRFEPEPIRFITLEELEYVRQSCVNLRDTAMVEFLYSTGCRVSEMCGLKIEDVNFVKGSVILFGKGSKYRLSYMNPKCKISLQAYLDSRDDNNPYLFVSQRKPHHQLSTHAVEDRIGIICRREENKSNKIFTPHQFRHTTATVAMRNGMPVQEVQRLLGHKNISTTMTYAECDQNDVQTSHEHTVL